MQKRLTPPLPPALRIITEDISYNYLPVCLAESKNQARENLYAINIDYEARSRIKFSDFENFLDSIKLIIIEKIKENSIIYFWLDPLANQLRFSITSTKDPASLFKTKIENVNPEKIINGYLKENIDSGLNEKDGLWVLSFELSPD